MPSQASVSALMHFDTASSQLSYSVSVSAITTTVTLAHIHGAPRGVSGPVVFDLLGSKALAPGTPLSGTLQLDAFAFDTLGVGGYYVNVHSQSFRGGELRGQLGPDSTSRLFLPQLQAAVQPVQAQGPVAVALAGALLVPGASPAFICDAGTLLPAL